MILNIFVGHRSCQGQSVTPDTGSDVRDTEGQSATVLLVNESWHGGGFRILVCCQKKKKKNESDRNTICISCSVSSVSQQQHQT